MTARYKGIIVRVVRIEAVRAYIIFQGKLKRVNKAHIEIVIDVSLIAGLVLSLALLGWLVAYAR